MNAIAFSQIFITYKCKITLPKNRRKITKAVLIDFFTENKSILNSQWVHPNIFIELKNKKLIDSIYCKRLSRKNKYFIKIDKKSFEIRFYTYFWMKWHDNLLNFIDNKIVKKYIISKTGFINLEIEKTTTKTIINHRSRGFRIDGIFKLPKIDICIEIMEEHHNINDETDLARPLKDVLSEATFRQENKMFIMMSLWEYKMKQDTYLDKFGAFIIEKIYLAHVTEKEFVIKELMKTFNDRYLAKAIYLSHKEQSEHLIRFKKFFRFILNNNDDIEKLFKLYLKDNQDSDSDEDTDSLSDFEDDDIDSKEKVKNYSSTELEKCKLNFSGFQDCFGIMIYNKDFDKSIRKTCKTIRDDILNKLIEAYKTIFKKQKRFLMEGCKIDSNKNYFND